MERWVQSVVALLVLQNIDSAILRNNALMNKMVNQFQDNNYNDNVISTKENEQDLGQHDLSQQNLDQHKLGQHNLDQHNLDQHNDEKPKATVVEMMQKVLCKNFPTIPCNIITKDPTLRNLIEKSVQQIKYKKMTIDKTTPPAAYPLTLFPVIDSEDLSNFLQVSDTFYKQKSSKKKRKNTLKSAVWSEEKTVKDKKQTTHSPMYSGRRKIRKFYPHKLKYKDKNNVKDDDYSGEKLSMSVEIPEPSIRGIKRKNFSYNSGVPGWRIDYTKHGGPNINVFGYESNLKGEIIKTGPSVMMDETGLEKDTRKEVLHPDIYIKKSYIRKQHKRPLHSENLD